MNMNENQVIEKQADSIIRNSIVFASGAGLIPVPVVDLMAVTAVQIEMIRRLSNLYKVDFKETEGKATILALTSGGVARLGGRMIAKMIPVIGSIVGGIATSAFSGAATYAVGEVFKRHFSEGGTFWILTGKALSTFTMKNLRKARSIQPKSKKRKPIINLRLKAKRPINIWMPYKGCMI